MSLRHRLHHFPWARSSQQHKSTIYSLPKHQVEALRSNLGSRIFILRRKLHSQASCQPAENDWNTHDEFFNFTRARFICNEAWEMAQRRVVFDMNELARVSAQAVGSDACINIEKYPDGIYSKAFLMIMDDGKQVVAKVPNPNAGQAHFTTASEVATMDFARTVCGTPVPKVFAWSSKAEENAVGAEYVIMERLTGVQLSSVWKTLPFDKKTEVVKSLALHQKKWTSTTLKQYGSLYYAQDFPKQQDQLPFSYIDEAGTEITDKRFSIGPTVHRHSIDYGRLKVEFDRGPWNTVEQHCVAIGHREIACVEAIEPLPKPPLTIVARYIPTRARKLAALKSYLKLIPFLLPTDHTITTSHIWHSDLHAENIFVDPDTPTQIIGIIDWQSVALVPLFENAIRPGLLDYDGPPLDGLERPEQPKGLEKLQPADRAVAFEKYMDMTLASYYQNLIYYTNKSLYHAIEYQQTISHDLLDSARNILIDGEAVYQERVVDELKKAWDTLPGVQALNNPPFPFTFSEKELAAIAKDCEGMCDGIVCLSQIQEEMGDLFPSDRCISHENYDAAKDKLRDCKDMLLKEFPRDEDERAAFLAWWPYD